MRSTLPPLAFAALLLLPVAARAGLPGYQIVTKNGPATVYTTPNKATVIYGNTSGITTAQQESLARAYGLAMPGNVAGGVRVADTVKVAIGGAVIDAVATRVVPASAYPAIAVAGAFAGGYAVGTAIYDYFSDNGIGYSPSDGFYRWVGGQTSTSYRFRAVYRGEINTGTLVSAEAEILRRVKAAYAAAPQYGQTSTTTLGCTSTQTGVWQCGFNTQTQNYQEYGPYNLYVQVTRHDDVWCMDANGQLTIRPTAGVCPEGTKDPLPPDMVPPLLTKPPSNPPGLVGEGVDKGADVPAGDPQLSGPSSGPGRAPGSSHTTNTGSSGQPGGSSSTVVNVTNNYHYAGDTVTVTQTVTEQTTNADGSTTETQSETEPDLLCGVPGFPPCNVKVEEKGTPEWVRPSNKDLEDVKTADAVKLNEVAQTIPQPDLGWFGAPPIAACRKIVFPHNIGEADPCGVVDSVRSVMAYLWAIVAAWMSFGWIRQAVNGG